ncbi:MAG TPA: hypothetical protein VMT89_15500, partial [Candidatus Acidoferrales bacterium]|nr:hypothetical protein [Candidatus Acidoferrales bacterium]
MADWGAPPPRHPFVEAAGDSTKAGRLFSPGPLSPSNIVEPAATDTPTGNLLVNDPSADSGDSRTQNEVTLATS